MTSSQLIETKHAFFLDYVAQNKQGAGTDDVSAEPKSASKQGLSQVSSQYSVQVTLTPWHVSWVGSVPQAES
jgi:hypothetical protein